MAKSIRSKIKRKHRSEFRKTIGTVRRWSSTVERLAVEAAGSESGVIIFQRLLRSVLIFPFVNLQEAYNKNMAKTQEKLKEYTESQQLNSLERLSKTLAVDNEDAATPAMETEEEPISKEAMTTKTALEYRGENKAIPNRKMSRKTKHMLAGKDRKPSSTKVRAERPKPRFFCQF